MKSTNNATSGGITLNDNSVELSGSSADVNDALADFEEGTYAGDIVLTTNHSLIQLASHK